MKIWKWYKNLTKEQYDASEDYSMKDKYPLYAFTVNKEHRDLFRKMRRKDAFIEMKSSISKEEYVEFANKYRGCLLDMYKYAKVAGRNGLEPVFKDIEVLSTWDEKEFVQSQIESFSDRYSIVHIQTYPFPPMIFKDKYFHALFTLQYVDFWKLFGEQDLSNEQEDMLLQLGVELDYSYPSLIFDEFAVFVSLYSDILK